MSRAPRNPGFLVWAFMILAAMCFGATGSAAQPSFTGLQPADGSLLSVAQGTLTGQVIDAATLSIDGQPVTFGADGTFSWSFELPEGERLVQLYAEDGSGQATSSVHRLTLDSLAPQVAVTQPSRSVVGATPVRVAGTLLEPHLATLTVAGVPAVVSAGTWEVDVPLTEGQQSLAVSAADTLGHARDFQITLVLDTTAPTVQVTESAVAFTGGVFNRAVVPAVESSDATELTLDTVLDGVPFTSGQTVSDEGSHRLDVIATDQAGNTTTVRVDFEIDLTAPTLGAVQPAPGTVLAATSATLQVEAGSASLVRVTGSAGSSETAGTGLVSVGPIVLEEGSNDLSIEVFDEAGNRTSRTHKLTRDTTPPVLTVTAPSDGDIVAASTVSAQGVAQDLRLQSVTVNGLLANLVGEGWTVTEVPVSEGANVLEVIASDSVGNQTTSTVTVSRDTAAPTFRVLVDGQVLVSGATFSAPVAPVIEVDDPTATVDATLDGAPFASGTEVSTDGSHELSLTVTSTSGVSASRLLVFVIDQQAPTISNLQPASGHLQREAELRLSGTVSGARSVTVDGQPAQLFQGSFSAGPFTLVDGVRTFEIVATGANGLQETVLHSIERDSTPPTVTLTSPSAGALLGEPSVSISGRAEDANLSSVSVNGTQATISASTWYVQSVPLAEGSNTLTVRAEDSANNVTEVTRSVVLDTEAPVVEISDPTPGALVPDATYVVRGSVDEEHLDRVDVEVTSVATGDVQSVRATVTDGAWQANVPLAAGTNQIVATARDLLGATHSDAGSIERDADAPQVAIVVPADNAYVSSPSIEVRGTVTDEEGTTVRVNGLVALIELGTWSVQNVPLSNGENRLLARAADAQGNEGVHTRTVFLDQNPPSFLASDPADGALALPVTSSFRLEFSEPLATPEEGSWSLVTAGGTAIAATASLDGSYLVLTPDGALPSQTQLVLTLTDQLADRAGNHLAEAPAPLTYSTVDAGAPGAPTLDFEPSGFLCAPSVVLTGSAESGSTVKAAGGLSSAQARASDADGSFLLEVELLADRLNRLELTATDRDGNVSPTTVVEVVQDCTAPEVVASQLTGLELELTFSEPVEQSTIAPSVSVRDAAGALSYTAATTTDGAVLTLSEAPAGAVILDVATGVRDLASNPLAYPYRRLFGDVADAESFVSGTVLDDATGRPLAGAIVQATATDGVALADPLPQQTTGDDGRFLLPLAAGTHDLTAVRPGYAPVFRIVTTQAGEGTSVFDPRLTPMASAVTLGNGGGSAPSAGGARLTLPTGALQQSTLVAVTDLGEQALPALLPYGWSPRGAVWIESEEDLQLAGSLDLPVSSAGGAMSDGTLLDIVGLDFSVLQWQVIDQVAVTDGAVTFAVPAVGAYAAVQADSGTLAPPPAQIGSALGSSPTPLGTEVIAASLTFDPEVVLPTQRAEATVLYTLDAASLDAPSGLPLTLIIEEELELLDGSVRREAPYQADLVVYRDAQGEPTSRFWLRPSDAARTQPLRLGGEDVTVRPYGDETVRGNVLGPDGGSVLNDAGDRLDVPAGALDQPAGIVLTRQTATDLPLPTPRGAAIDAVLDLDLGGARLSSPAALTVELGAAPAAGSKGLLLQVVEVSTGGPEEETAFRVVAELVPTTTGWTTATIDLTDLPWPGVRTGGQLAAVSLTEDHGFVRGQVFDTSGLDAAGVIVSSASVDWIQLTDEQGRYVLPLPLGDHVVTSTDPATGNAAQVAVSVAAGGERIDLDPTLQVVAPWIVEVSPADGAEGVPVGIEPTVRFSEPINRATLAAGLELRRVLQSGGEPVAVEYDHQGDFVRVLPQSNLVPGSDYELRIGGELRDLDGYGLNGPLTTTFRTEDDPSTSGRLDRSLVVTLAPDSQGLAQITGQPGAVPGGSLVYVENLTSYSTTESVTADPDGAFQLTIGASLDDRLLLHVLIEGSSEDLMLLGPFLSADQKSAYVPLDGAAWTTIEGFGVEVEEGTFDRPTWVRMEGRTDGPVETPETFQRFFDFEIGFGGATPAKNVFVWAPMDGSLLPDREVLLVRYLEALGEGGWMVMDFLRPEDGQLTNSPVTKATKSWGGLGDELASASDYSIPDRHRVLSLEEASLLRERPGAALFRATVRPRFRDLRDVEGVRSKLAARSLAPKVTPGYETIEQITDPRDAALGLVEPGHYQGIQSQEPIRWLAIPVERPDLHFSSYSYGGAPFVASITTSILVTQTYGWVILPTRENHVCTLEIRDLTSGYQIARNVIEASNEPLTIFPPDIYDAVEPPIPVAGGPIQFFLIQPATDVSDVAITDLLSYSYAEEVLSVEGVAGFAQPEVEAVLFALDSDETILGQISEQGALSISLTGVESKQRALLAVGARMSGDEKLEIRFSKGLDTFSPGVELFPWLDGKPSTRAVEADLDLHEDGTLMELAPLNGWRKGSYDLRLSDLIAPDSDATDRELDVTFEVLGSSNLGTLELDQVGDMALLGSVMFMASLNDGLMLWDVSHPRAPRSMLTRSSGEARGFQFPSTGAVRGVDIDSHGRAIVVGGGEGTNGQMKVVDIQNITWAAVGAATEDTMDSVVDYALVQGSRGSTLISDPIAGTISTGLRRGMPRRVAVMSNDEVHRWRLWDKSPPTGIQVQPTARPTTGVETQVTISGEGVDFPNPVSLHNVTRGRVERELAAADGTWSVTIDAVLGDEVELRLSRDTIAYATIDGAGIAVVDVADFFNEAETESNVSSSVLGYSDGVDVSSLNGQEICDKYRPAISNHPVDIEVLYDPSKEPKLSILTLYTGFGLGIQKAELETPRNLEAVSAACGAIDEQATLTALDVVQRYPMDLDESGYLDADEYRDYAVLGHGAGHVIVIDVTNRLVPFRVAEIKLGKKDDRVNIASLSIDERGRRIFVSAFGAGLYVVDFDSAASLVEGFVDSDQDKLDDRVVESIEVNSEEVTEILLMPNVGVAFAGGRAQGLTGLLVGGPQINALAADAGPLRAVADVAPFGVPTNEATGAETLQAPGLVRYQAYVPGLSSQTTSKTTIGDARVFLDVLGVGPGDEVFDDAGSGIDLPKTAFAESGALEATRQADEPWEEGYRLFLSDPVVLLSDLRASDKYEASDEEKEICNRCDLVDEGVYPEERAEDEMTFRELLSGHEIRTSLSDREIAAGLDSFYENSPHRDSASEVGSVPWDISPAVNQEPRHAPPTGHGDVAPGTLLHSGEMTMESTDVAIEGRGLHFNLGRSYRNQTLGSGPLGPGWDHSYRIRLRELPNGDVEYFDASGRRETFVRQDSGEFEAPKGLFVKLERTSSGWTMIDPGKNRIRFDRWGRLVSISDPLRTDKDHGNEMNFVYDGYSRLTRVDDALDRSVQFSYNQDGLLDEIVDFADRSWVYRYDANQRLDTFETPPVPVISEKSGLRTKSVQRLVTRYGYESTGTDLRTWLGQRDNVVSVTDPKGHEWLKVIWADQNGDGLQDEIETQTWGEHDVQVSLGLDGQPTTVTDRRGHPTIYQFNSEGQTTRVTDQEEKVWNYSYDGEGLLERSVAPGGLTREFTFETAGDRRARGNVKAIRETPGAGGDNGSGDTVETQVEYHAETNQPTRIISPRGAVTEIVRKESGLVESITVAKDQPEAGTTRFGYNDFGQVVETTNPTGRITQLDYFEAEAGDPKEFEGYLKKITDDVNEKKLASVFEVDELGRTKAVIDPRGVRSELDYNVLGWQTELRQAVSGSSDGAPPLGYVHRTSYDENGNVAELEAPFGENEETAKTTWSYGVLDEVKSATQEVGEEDQKITQSWEYDKNYNVKQHTDGEGHLQKFEYDKRDLLKQITRGLGPNATLIPIIETYTFDADRRLENVIDGNQNAWSREYDGYGRLRSMADPLGNQTTWEYDAEHNATTTLSLNSAEEVLAETRRAYDLRNRRQELTRILFQNQTGLPSTTKTSIGNEVTTRFVFDAASKVKNVTDPKGRTTTYEYDSVDRLEKVTDPYGNIRTLGYDDASNLVEQTLAEKDGDGATHPLPWTFKVDALGRQIEREDPLGNTWKYSLDSRGLVRRATDPDSFTTTYRYDALDRLRETIRPEGISIEYGYDAAHRLTSYEDALGQTTRYAYDAAHRNTSVTYPDGNLISKKFDNGGNLERLTDPMGTVVTHDWDDANRLLSRAASPPQEANLAGPLLETYSYDGLNRLVSGTSGGISCVRSYDSLSRVISETTNGRTVHVQRDETGMPWQTTLPSGHQIERQFDGLDRPELILGAGAVLGDFDYRGIGPKVHYRKLANDYEHAFEFDGAGRVESSRITGTEDPLNSGGEEKLVFEEKLTWNSRWLKSTSYRQDLGVGRVFDYDGAGRVAAISALADAPEKLGIQNRLKQSMLDDDAEAEFFTYNPAQSMTSRTRVTGGIETTIDLPPDGSGRNRPGQIGDVPLVWDANGNLRGRGGLEFVYDWRNRLREVYDEGSGNQISQYDYDVFNRRVSKTTGGDTTESVYEGWQEVERYKNGQINARQTYGSGIDEILQIERDLDGNGTLEQKQYPIYDTSGNLAMLADADGKPMERYEYSSYAMVSIHTGQIEPKIEQIRVVGDEIWIESDVPLFELIVQQGIEDGTIFLEETALDDKLPLSARHPIKLGPNARRRLIVTTTDPPASGREVRLVLPRDDLQDTYWNRVAEDIDLAFEWQPQILLDTAAPRIVSVVHRNGFLEVEWSETPDLESASDQIFLDNQTREWALDETTYRMVTTLNIGLGDHTLRIETGPTALNGEGLEEQFTVDFLALAGFEQYVYLARNPREIDYSAVGNDIAFQGRPEDPETGLIYFRNRYYDPELGVFVTADPLGYIDGPSMYAFAGFDPVNGSDPLGLLTGNQAADEVVDGALKDRCDLDPDDPKYEMKKVDCAGMSFLGELGVGILRIGTAIGEFVEEISDPELWKNPKKQNEKLQSDEFRLKAAGAVLETAEVVATVKAGTTIVRSGVTAIERSSVKLVDAADDAVRASTDDLGLIVRAADDSAASPQRFWTKTTEHSGVKVFQRDDLIDLGVVDARGRTNLQRMQKGLAPLGPDGQPVNLHHMLQTQDGAIAEVAQTFHQMNSRTIHINPSSIPSGIDRQAFDRWKYAYWQERAKELAAQQGGL